MEGGPGLVLSLDFLRAPSGPVPVLVGLMFKSFVDYCYPSVETVSSCGILLRCGLHWRSFFHISDSEKVGKAEINFLKSSLL